MADDVPGRLARTMIAAVVGLAAGLGVVVFVFGFSRRGLAVFAAAGESSRVLGIAALIVLVVGGSTYSLVASTLEARARRKHRRRDPAST